MSCATNYQRQAISFCHAIVFVMAIQGGSLPKNSCIIEKINDSSTKFAA